MEILKPTKRKVEEYILVKESLKQKNDDIKWMEMLTKNGKSKVCIIQFIETRICNDPFNQILWNLYILYLEKEKSIDVLNVYSRHCRLFTDKISMRNKYFQAAIKFHKNDVNVAKWLIDLVKIEEDFVSITSSINLMEKILTEIYNSKIELPENSNYDEIFAIFKQKIECKNVDSMENEILPTIILRQNFSIPVTVIRSMLNTGSATQIQKLLKCCKYFCIKFKPTVIHKLCLTKIPQSFMYQNSFFVNNQNIEKFTIDNIWLSNSLVIDMCIPVVGGINLTKFFFPKIYKCDVRFLCIIDHRLTAAEFDFLTKSEKVESLKLDRTSIIDLEGIEYPLENIIIKCPNAYKFRLSSVPCTSNTAKILSSLNHKTKVNYFSYYIATEEFNVNEFLNFVMKNGTVNSTFFIRFIPNLQFKSMYFQWISSDKKPNIATN